MVVLVGGGFVINEATPSSSFDTLGRYVPFVEAVVCQLLCWDIF